MAKQKVRTAQIDWSSLSLNIKSKKSTSGATPTNGANTNLDTNGCSVSFTVAADCKAFVTVHVGCSSTTDFEHKPQIWLDGSLYSMSDITASVNGGGASNRSIQRSHSALVSLTAGAHTLSAGISVSSASSQNVRAGDAEIAAIVLGQVTA